MYLRNGLLFDINVQQVLEDGTYCPPGFFSDPEVRALHGVEEIPDPVWPDARFYNATQMPDGSLVINERPLSVIQNDLKARATAKRYQVESGGVDVGGVRVGTDKVDQAAITGALATLREGFVTTINWKGSSGWVQVGLTELTAIAAAVAQHVQTCFSAERAKHEEIDAATTLEELQAIDVEGGWPA